MKSFTLLVAGGILLYALISNKSLDLFKALFNLQPPGATLATPPVAPAVSPRGGL